jgi:hypothetical protein
LHLELTGGGSIRVVIEVVQDKTLDMSNWSGLFFIGKGDDLTLPAGKKDKPKNTAARKIELTSAIHPTPCASLL